MRDKKISESFKKKKSKVALDPIADAAAPRGNAVDDSAAQPAQVRRKTSPTRTITLRPVVRRTMLFKPRPRPVRRARRRGPRARRRARRRKARWSRRGRWQKRRKLAQKRMLRQGGKRRLKPGSLDKDAVAQRLRKKSLRKEKSSLRREKKASCCSKAKTSSKSAPDKTRQVEGQQQTKERSGHRWRDCWDSSPAKCEKDRQTLVCKAQKRASCPQSRATRIQTEQTSNPCDQTRGSSLWWSRKG